MTTENLKAVLTEEELGRVSHVTMIAEGAKSESPKTFSGCIVSFFYHTVLEILSIISRLADEVVRLERYNSERKVKYFKLMERYEETLGRALGYGGVDMRPVGGEKDGVCLGELPADMLPELAEKRIRELESKLEAWEDAEKIKLNKICGFGRCVFCGSTPSTTPGTYHLNPAEADDAQGN